MRAIFTAFRNLTSTSPHALTLQWLPSWEISEAEYVARKYFDIHSAAHIQESGCENSKGADDAYATLKLAGLTPGEGSVALKGSLFARALLLCLCLERASSMAAVEEKAKYERKIHVQRDSFGFSCPPATAGWESFDHTHVLLVIMHFCAQPFAIRFTKEL